MNSKSTFTAVTNYSVSFMGLLSFVAFVTLVFSAAPAVAEEFKVGGDEAWRPPAANETEMYDRWTAALRFRVGDSLRFVYKKDTVALVDKWGYYHCNSSHAAVVFNSGNTVVRLERPGSVYFISANVEHCRNGQRVMVEVMSLHPTPAAPSPSPNSGAGLSGSVYLCCALLVVAGVASISM